MRALLRSRQDDWEKTVPHIKTSDGVRLYYEETGTGEPLVFLHEFGGHHLIWEPQVRYFSRRYRCITCAARDWPPSDVPDKVEAYSQARAADDCADLLKALGIVMAHLCGLSMGATAALEFAIRHPGKALSLVIAPRPAAGVAPTPRPRRASRRNARRSRAGSNRKACRPWLSFIAQAQRATPIATRIRAARRSSSNNSPTARLPATP
jgi:pimeloyl-ACP methyl ester carboxylesterase